jgi:catechol 2,3-dioxygenase-like lactoylglutathione lyase family enzyme
MKPRIRLLSLGVDDLERSLAFYADGLGFPPKALSAASSSTARRVLRPGRRAEARALGARRS